MAIFDRLREGIFRVRVVPKQTPEDVTTFTDEKNSTASKINEAIDAGKRIDLTDLLKITTLRGDRNVKYSAFEEMANDGRIGAALEMYANDSVQYNHDGKVVWAESSNSDVAKYVNKLLDDLNIENDLWSWAYCLCLYGDVYLETFENTSTSGKKPTLLVEPTKPNPSIRTQIPIEGAKLERYIEKVPNPAEVYDLQYKGKTSGFIKSASEDLQNKIENNTYLYSGMATNINVLSPTKFVHICLSPNINRFPERFKLIRDEEIEKVDEKGRVDASGSEGFGGGSSLSFTVKTGQSILENVYGAYQTLKLKEESVLLERVTKASITRVIQVELGDMPESQKKRKLMEIKQQIEQQMILNKEAGSIQSRSGGQPIENIIYTTTKNGKGVISTVNIGGEGNIGDLADVEDSENKLFGSLLIPKGLLGADMEGSGLSNGGSLTEMNTTYARRIKRIQVALCNGITTLVNIFALAEGLGEKMVNNFTIHLTPIITIEDNRRDELLQNKIRNVTDMLGLVQNLEAIDDTTKLNMLIEWLSKYLNQQDIVDIINDRIKDLEAEGEDPDSVDKDGNEDDIPIRSSGGGFSRGSSFGPSFNEKPSTEEPTETETTETETETNTTPQLAPQVNLADIEGQDLI